MPDLARLSEGERACLRLLATGHDTKSLSTVLAITPAAATERLRSARAKLGVTSSREAARLLVAAETGVQETWAMNSGVGQPAEAVQAGPERRDWPFGKGGLLVMILSVFAVGGALVFVAAEKPQLPPEPRVVSAKPAAGSTIPSGPFVLSVTYDRAMAANSWSFVRTGQGAYPACEGRPVQSADGKTFSLHCTAVAGTAYAVAFNAGRFRNFRSASGVAAQPYLLRFSAR